MRRGLRVVVSERVACLVMSRRKGAVRRVAEESILNVRVSTGGYELSLGLECRVAILSRVTESLAKDEAISLERGLAQPFMDEVKRAISRTSWGDLDPLDD